MFGNNKMDKLELQLSALEKTLKGSENNNDEETKKATRLSIVKMASQDMSEEEKKEARKALETEEEKKDASDKPEEEKKDAMTEPEEKKGKDEEKHDEMKKSNEDYDELKKGKEELEKKIASLSASLNYVTAQPYVDKMLSARQNAGMKPNDLDKFKKSLYGKSIDEIKQRYEEDRILYGKSMVASDITDLDSISFNGEDFSTLNASANDDLTFEEMYS